MPITSREQLIEYCLRKLGDPVIEINVAEEQLEDKVDDALQLYQEFHDDATLTTYLKYQITATDVTNGYIPISPEVIYLVKLFPMASSTFGGIFGWKYQLFLNDLAWLNAWSGELSYYYQMRQYLELIDMTLTGQPQITFSRKQNRLYIWGEWYDGDLKEGDWVIAEVVQIIDPEVSTSIYDDMFMKEYTTALIKQQWGTNMSKFEGMQLPGGVTISGRQLLEDANAEIDTLRERLRLEQELPVDFLIG